MPRGGTRRGAGRKRVAGVDQAVARTATVQQRRAVALAAGANVPRRHIARALGITVHELARDFAVELATGAAAHQMEAMQGLFLAAKRGRAGAVRAYLKNKPDAAPPRR